jgi:transposase-like protein
MLIVADDAARTEAELAAGELSCPDCHGELRPWGYARPRWLRTFQGRRRTRPRRACCRDCGRTHVLLPGMMLARRADAVEVIGAALIASSAGAGHRPIAARLGRPHATVRGWLRRFVARAEQTAAHAARCVYRLDTSAFRIEPAAGATPVQAALELLARAAALAEHVKGSQARSRWQVVSSLCQGRLLANTNCPYPPLA